MSNLSMEDFTQDDLVDFQRAFQMQTKIESSPSFRDGDAEKLLRKVNLKLDDDKKRFINNQGQSTSGSTLSPVAASSGQSKSERVDFLDLLENMSRNFVDDGTTEQELEDAFKILKPGSDSSDELMFSDFEKAYKRMGEEFSQVIALEEVQEIFEHFQVKRKNSGQPPTEESSDKQQGSSEVQRPAGKTSETKKNAPTNSKPQTPAKESGKAKKSAVGKIRMSEFIKTVSQDSNN